MFKLEEGYNYYSGNEDEINDNVNNFAIEIQNHVYNEYSFGSKVYDLFIETIKKNIAPFLEEDVEVTYGDRYDSRWANGYIVDAINPTVSTKVTFIINQTRREIFIWFPENMRTFCGRLGAGSEEEKEKSLYFLKKVIKHVSQSFQYHVKTKFLRGLNNNPEMKEVSKVEKVAGALQAIVAWDLENNIDQIDDFTHIPYIGRDIITTGGLLDQDETFDTVASLLRRGILSPKVMKAKTWDYYKAAESLVEFSSDIEVYPVIQFNILDDMCDLIFSGQLGAGLFSYARDNSIAHIITRHCVISAINPASDSGVIIDMGGMYSYSFAKYIHDHGGLIDFPASQDTIKTLKNILKGSRCIGRPISNNSYITYDWAHPFHRLVNNKPIEFNDEDERD